MKGLNLLIQFGASKEELDDYRKRFSLAYETYSKTIKKNNLTLLSELIRPSSDRIKY